MPVYAISDLQGCYYELRKLLDQINFDPVGDHLWFVGDLVNRGPDSLSVLRFVRDLGHSAKIVLGNHDLHLLALAAGNRVYAKKNTLDSILQAPDRDELLTWLRHLPLLYHDQKLGFTMIHAGLPPQWDLNQAKACSYELEMILQSDDQQEFFLNLYGDNPAQWSADLTGIDRLRFITNCFTRLRFCNKNGRLALAEKNTLGKQEQGLIPWFQVPQRRTRNERIVFGHWSTLGYLATDNIWAIDTGCLWGGALTALRLDLPIPQPIYLKCAGYLKPDIE